MWGKNGFSLYQNLRKGGKLEVKSLWRTQKVRMLHLLCQLHLLPQEGALIAELMLLLTHLTPSVLQIFLYTKLFGSYRNPLIKTLGECIRYNEPRAKSYTCLFRCNSHIVNGTCCQESVVRIAASQVICSKILCMVFFLRSLSVVEQMLCI